MWLLQFFPNFIGKFSQLIATIAGTDHGTHLRFLNGFQLAIISMEIKSFFDNKPVISSFVDFELIIEPFNR